MSGRHGPWVGALALLGLIGCGQAPEAPAGTGAREAVRNYYDALLHEDWSRAYASLHLDARKRYNAAEFTRLAERYRRDLGFEPKEVHLGACEEHGTEAIAHVLFLGDDGKPRTYKEAVMLRQSETGWGIVPPRNFGQPRR